MQKIKSSSVIWKYSGLSYRTAVMATRGKYERVEDYFTESGRKIQQLALDFKNRSVMEFGCGMGGNLIYLSHEISDGVGFDINPGYLRLARKFAREQNMTNLKFLMFDGKDLPRMQDVDIIYSLNVFERIPVPQADILLSQLRKRLKPNGVFACTFLGENARNTGFSDRLGREAYTFWTKDSIEESLERTGWLEKGSAEISDIPIMPGESNSNAFLTIVRLS